MPPVKHERLTGWGNFPAAECLSYRPEKAREPQALLRSHNGPLLARGLGRAYGDAALQPDGILRTERLDHIIAFDEATGRVQAQAGVTLAELMDVSIPRGWLPPVLPGTRHVTLGGAFACNVHGKNQFKDGDFAEHVQNIQLLLANGQRIECSPAQNAELFWATAGGMGMTGIIEQVTLQLRLIASTSLRATAYRVASMDDMIAAFEHYRGSADYMIGWIDHMASGDTLGRGVFEAAQHIGADDGGQPLAAYTPHRQRAFIPFNLPSFLLNRYSMALYNRWRFKRYGEDRRTTLTGFADFFHPLDALGHWNRLYGRRGFLQYQCLLPETQGVAASLRSLLATIQRQGCFSFLAVLKYHRPGKSLLAFSQAGYSLALDFPNTRRVRNLLPQLDRWMAEQGGRIYLAKDALLSPEMFRAMYGTQGAAWLRLLRQCDAAGKFRSLMSERLQWKS